MMSSLRTVLALLTLGPATLVSAGAQQVRPDALPYYRQVTSMPRLQTVASPRLSPDGRWLAFNATTAGQPGTHIWVVRSGGGTPVQLTTGDHSDWGPAWFPQGDRLAFESNRVHGIMTIGMDPATGSPVGPLKRVTLDTTSGGDVSPDGRWIVYPTSVGEGLARRTRLRVVPGTGGEARTLAELPGSVRFPRFDRDGRFVYFTHLPENTESPKSVSRVPVAGGPATVIGPVRTGNGGIIADPVANRVLVRDGSLGHVYTLAGDSIATFAWAQGVGVAGTIAFAADGSSLLTATSTTVAVTSVLPLDGGVVRTVGTPGNDEYPFEWVGNRLYFWDSRNPRPGVTFVTADGRERGFLEVDPPGVKPTPESIVRIHSVSPDGRYFAVVVEPSAPNADWPLHIFDSRARTTRLVTPAVARRAFVEPYRGYGHFGTGVLGDEIIYLVDRRAAIEVRAEKFSGGGRLLYTVTKKAHLGPDGNQPVRRHWFSVAADRIAEEFTFGNLDSMGIDITIGNGTPRRALTLPGAGVRDMAFSPDGRTLFASIMMPSPGAMPRKRRGVFLSTDQGGATQPPRWVDLPEFADGQMVWAPDGRSVLLMTWGSGYYQGSIWQIPATGSQPPQQVSRQGVGKFDTFKLSPDGRAAMIAVEQNQGSILWRIDLNQAAAAGQRGGNRR